MAIIIDAKDLILGRMAAMAAKKALLGEEVIIVNAEQAVISGKKADVVARYKAKVAKGIPLKGPYFPRQPDRLVRRTVRGMLPWKRAKGREAFKRVMCYIGVPEQYQNMKHETMKSAHVGKLPTLNRINVKELCRLIGAKL